VSVELKIAGNVATLNFDDSLSNVVIGALFALIFAVGGLFFRPLYGISIGLLLITPAVAAIWLSFGPPAHKRTLRIDRHALVISGSKSGEVRKHRIRSFQSVQVLRFKIPRAGTQHQVRVLTSDGPLLVTAFPSRAQADELAIQLATWLGVKMLYVDSPGLSAAFDGGIKIWR